jgi:hypothetical protein
MAAPKGNQFWKIAGDRTGRPLIFKTPEDLWSACCAYFEWVDKHPLKEAKPFSYEGKITIARVDKMRAMTIGGLCLFLGITRTTWKEYGDREDFSAIVTRAEEIIRTQKFEGAAAELLNPNIIARDLGLADKSEHTGGVNVTIVGDDADL